MRFAAVPMISSVPKPRIQWAGSGGLLNKEFIKDNSKIIINTSSVEFPLRS